jgi:hypothetical protein
MGEVLNRASRDEAAPSTFGCKHRHKPILIVCFQSQFSAYLQVEELLRRLLMAHSLPQVDLSKFKSDDSDFAHLSLKDLITARDLYHVYLMRHPNVIATAVGRYRIRKADSWPNDKKKRLFVESSGRFWGLMLEKAVHCLGILHYGWAWNLASKMDGTSSEAKPTALGYVFVFWFSTGTNSARDFR